MNINNLWYICLLVRVSFIFLIRTLYDKNNTNNLMLDVSIYVLMAIGLGFLYKGFTGSNNEIQISKVFWHDTRYIHGIFYVCAGLYLYNGNLNMTTLLLTSDIIFSIMYRLSTNQ